MDLLIDDKPFAQDADAAALERTLARFKTLGHLRLTLRREPKRQLTISRFEGELFVEVQTPGALEGVVASGWEEAAGVARDYHAGRAVRLSFKPQPGLSSIVFGDAYHPDCPLCRAAKAGA